MDRERAARMESILYRIKNLNGLPEDSVEGLLDSQAQDLIQ